MKVRRFAFGLGAQISDCAHDADPKEHECDADHRIVEADDRCGDGQTDDQSYVDQPASASRVDAKSVRLCFNFDGFDKQGFTLLPVLLHWRRLETGPREFARKPWKHLETEKRL